jgi:hypothetical protein
MFRSVRNGTCIATRRLQLLTNISRSTFSTTEKKAYISAVQCLAKLPPKTAKAVCPGCRNRYDDFVATHIQQSFGIHVTGNFLTWVIPGLRWCIKYQDKLTGSSIDTSPGPTSRHCATSVVTRAINPTTTTRDGQRTLQNRHCLMALTHQSLVKAPQAARTKPSPASRSTPTP